MSLRAAGPAVSRRVALGLWLRGRGRCKITPAMRARPPTANMVSQTSAVGAHVPDVHARTGCVTPMALPRVARMMGAADSALNQHRHRGLLHKHLWCANAICKSTAFHHVHDLMSCPDPPQAVTCPRHRGPCQAGIWRSCQIVSAVTACPDKIRTPCLTLLVPSPSWVDKHPGMRRRQD